MISPSMVLSRLLISATRTAWGKTAFLLLSVSLAQIKMGLSAQECHKKPFSLLKDSFCFFEFKGVLECKTVQKV